MPINTPLDTDDIAWINGYAAEVRDQFSTEFGAAEDRFARWRFLLRRFTDTVDYVLKNGRGYFSAVDEAHNEQCIASAILANPNPRIVRLDYEPPLPDCAKSIDLSRGRGGWNDFFTWTLRRSSPVAKDRWSNMKRHRKSNGFRRMCALCFPKIGWAARSGTRCLPHVEGMLEYALELEAKIAQAKLGGDNSRLVMAFCGAGFHWRRDELEDFVSFYFTGRHRADDPFSQAELKYMTEKKLGFCPHHQQLCLYEPPTGHDSPKADSMERPAATRYV